MRGEGLLLTACARPAEPPGKHPAGHPGQAGANDDRQLRRVADRARHQLQVCSAAAAHPLHQLLPGAAPSERMPRRLWMHAGALVALVAVVLFCTECIYTYFTHANTCPSRRSCGVPTCPTCRRCGCTRRTGTSRAARGIPSLVAHRTHMIRCDTPGALRWAGALGWAGSGAGESAWAGAPASAWAGAPALCSAPAKHAACLNFVPELRGSWEGG